MILIEDAVKVAMDFASEVYDRACEPDEEDKEFLYQEMEQKDWIGDNRGALKKMQGLIADINPEEIASHIVDDKGLVNWTKAWRASAEMVLKAVTEGK